MPDLSPCMRLVVRMPQADQDEVVARVDAYTNSGIPAAQAQRMAVADLIAEIDADAAELRGLAEAAMPAAPVLSQTETSEFKRWFGDSKVVDEDGRPLVVYHGAHRDFSAFDASAPSSHIPLPGFYFTPDPGIASMFAESGAKMAENKAGRPYEPIGATVMPAYLSLQNPFEFDASEGAMKGFVSEKIIKEIILDAKRKGHDGVIIRGWRDGSGPVQYVAFRPEQIKSAIGNSGAFDPTNPDIRASLPEEPAPEAGPGFYSALRRELANAKTNASPAEYWRNLIKGAVSKGLVKADEVQWSGVEDWLAAQPGKISKTDMLDLLDLRGVRVEETVLSDIGDDIPIHGSDAKYGQYTLPGGTNYKEILLTLPERRPLTDVWRSAQEMYGDDDPRTIAAKKAAKSEAGPSKAYRSAHWDQPNVLAHIRVNDRVDAEGKRVLFVEEIQSDWAQQGKKDGFRAEDATRKPTKAAYNEAGYWEVTDQNGQFLANVNGYEIAPSEAAALQEVERRMAEQTTGGYASDRRVSRAPFVAKREFAVFKDGAEVTRTGKDGKEVRERYGSMEAAQAAATKKGGEARDMGYGEDTEAWVSLALKRIVKMAVDGGYDKVAFVTGEQSAERYSLDKHVGRVTYVPSMNGGTLLVTDTADNSFVIKETNVTPEKVADYVGKDVAEKLLAQPLKDGSHVLKGAGLKVPQGGMRAFYDKIVPSVLKDVLRKVGGGALATARIDRGNPEQTYDKIKPFLEWMSRNHPAYTAQEASRMWASGPENNQFVEDYVAETRSLTQPAFDITPAMREQVARGLPLFSQVEATTLAASTPPTWDAPAPTRLDNLLYAVQNKQIDLKRVTDAIKESGQQLSDRKDPYLREELYHGRAAYRVQRFAEGEVDPLLKEMRMAQVSVQALDEYLHARHARERNAEMKARNLNRPDNDALSGMSDADAAKILANARPVMRTLAARVDAIIEGTRNLLEVAGLETPEMVDALRNSYQHYVPLHRDELDTTGGQGTGMGYSIRGSTVKRATGSTAAVTNILAHVVAERERVITRAEKNVVGLALYATALQNPNEDFWKPDTPPQKSIIDERVNVFNPGTGQMEANPNYGQVVLRTDPGYKSQPNVLVLRVNGEDRALVFNDRNERAMRMATSLKNLDVEALGAAGEAMAWATRHLAAVNTQYNPVFAVKNMVRDLGAGMANLSTTEIAGKQLQVLAGVAPALSAIYARERGDAPVVGDWGDAYELYQKHGGKTAFREQFVDIDARAKDLMKKLDGSSPADAVRPLTDFVADVNTAVENAVRLSAFRVALANGVSKDRAASLAKNLTVNFNRKGAKTRGIAALYAFFNAAIQGNARLVETLKGPMGKQIAGGMLTLGFVQALLLASMDPEDEENVPGYIKRTSFVIPNGKNPIYIPLPLGLHVFPNIGRAAAETIFDFRSGKPNATEEAKTRTVELLGTLLDALSPVGGVDNPVLTMLPTPVDWVGALAMNRDWQNRPISRERGPGEESRPGYEMGRDSTSPVYKALAKGIHNTFNPTPYARNPELPGMLSPTPEAIRYIPESLLGGVWRETEKLLDFTRQAATGDEIDQGRIPLLSAFRGDLGSNMAPVSAFWKHVGRADAAERAAKGADRNDAEVPNDPYLDLAGEARAARKALADINKERRELALEGYDANKAQIRALEKEAADVMREFNSAAREALSRR